MLGANWPQTIDEARFSLFPAIYEFATQEKAARAIHLAEHSDLRTRRRGSGRCCVHVLAGRILDALGRARDFCCRRNHGFF